MFKLDSFKYYLIY